MFRVGEWVDGGKGGWRFVLFRFFMGVYVRDFRNFSEMYLGYGFGFRKSCGLDRVSVGYFFWYSLFVCIVVGGLNF